MVIIMMHGGMRVAKTKFVKNGIMESVTTVCFISLLKP